jgi:Asp-tRNA(Asn)/Glu-tRNA(Gln) amidotransferase A subunit family amidase
MIVPQISLPVAIVDGAGPVGLSLIGWQGGYEVLLTLAASLEAYCHPSLIC